MHVVTVLHWNGNEKHKGSFIIYRFVCRILNTKEIELHKQQRKQLPENFN